MKRRRARWRLGAAALGVAASLAVSALSAPIPAQSGPGSLPATTSTVGPTTTVPAPTTTAAPTTTVPAPTTTAAPTTTVPAPTTTAAPTTTTVAPTPTTVATTTSTVPTTTSTTAATTMTAVVSPTTTTTTPNQPAVTSTTEAPPPGVPVSGGSPGTPAGTGTTVPAAPGPAAEEDVPGAGEAAGGRAPTRGQGPSAPPPAPVVALKVPPPGRPAPPAVSSRQVAEVLEAAAARRRDLNARVVDAEATVVRLDAQVVSADSALAALRTEHDDVAARLAAAEAARRQHERASSPVPAPPPATAEAPPKPAPRRNPLARLWRRAVDVGRSILPDPPASAVRVPDGVRARDEARRRGAELGAAVTDLRRRLETAQQATTAAEAGVAATAVELDDARRALAVARAALSSAIADVAFGPAALGATLGNGGPASDLALADIPADYLPVYRAAASACPGLSWTVLAAVGAIESAHGRAAAPGVREGANYAGAMGPMQFLAPTWAAYGLDGNGDGTADVYNPVDAVYGAANYLCASGGGDPGRLGGALWAYNHADWYVRDVLDLATRYGGASLRTTPLDGAQLLANPNLVVTPEAAADLAAGRVDDRVVAALGAVVARHRIKVSVFESGHSTYVKGTDRVSNHYYGRAVDIYEVDGAPVSASNDAALELAVALLTAESSLRPDELGSPWPELSQFPGAFSDADHAGHLHLGWSAPNGRTGEFRP